MVTTGEVQGYDVESVPGRVRLTLRSLMLSVEGVTPESTILEMDGDSAAELARVLADAAEAAV